MRKNIVTILNFVRAEDPRWDQNALYDTVRNQLKICMDSHMPYVYHLQYDAMIQERYISLFRGNPDPNRELGVWFELCRELIEKVGLEWKGQENYRWDWHVCPDMLMAYSISERKMIIDEVMRQFHELFGYYPRSVGSWLLDSDSLQYLKEKYNIAAAIICREQYGTDGYTLWGGYYNQAYYPCRENALCPAQTREEQIEVPVFRMLGPDPIYQYQNGLDENLNPSPIQKVMTLEPVWKCGQSPDWVDWFLHCNFEEENLGFGFTQTGQENSFLWDTQKDGLKMQLPKIREGAEAGRWEVMKLKDAGEWFSSQYSRTPPTAYTALTDWDQSQNQQSVWFDSLNYRTNIYVKNKKIFIRDIFLFDERWPELYRKEPAQGNNAIYENLPIVDGYRWSGDSIQAGFHFVKAGSCDDLDVRILQVSDKPISNPDRVTDSFGEKTETQSNTLYILCETGEKTFQIVLDEEEIQIPKAGRVGLELLLRAHDFCDTRIEGIIHCSDHIPNGACDIPDEADSVRGKAPAVKDTPDYSGSGIEYQHRKYSYKLMTSPVVKEACGYRIFPDKDGKIILRPEKQ